MPTDKCNALKGEHLRYSLTSYICLLAVYIVFFVVAMLLAPVLPLFSQMRSGPVNNRGSIAVEPRLPNWLYWFDTTTDNSLWGDSGWRTIHCPGYWDSYWGMVLWLWRNPACGFSWSVAAHDISWQIFHLCSSGCSLNLDKGAGQQGWFLIWSNDSAFQFRWVKEWIGLQVSFEAGWLLDVYLKNRQAIIDQPRAVFMFQPRIVRKK